MVAAIFESKNQGDWSGGGSSKTLRECREFQLPSCPDQTVCACSRLIPLRESKRTHGRGFKPVPLWIVEFST